MHDFGETLTAIQLGETLAAGFEGGRFRMVAGDEIIWQETVEDDITSIAAGDVNGDGEIEIAVGTESGHIHLFSLALDQPLLLTKPDLTGTRIGYTYSVNVNDPEGEAVPVILEIWDPSAGTWLVQPAQPLADDQGQGRLSWEVPEPFDMWDSGQESRFRFSYDDGSTQRTTPEIPGPFNIPTTPWYIYYGQRIGLGALILAIPILGLLRQRAYRRSPVGRAKAILKRLRTNPGEALLSLHRLTGHNPTQLSYLSSLAREAGDTDLADLSEGFHLILTRSEVAAEVLRAILGATEQLAGSKDEQMAALTSLYDLFLQALEANTVNRIVTLRPRLNEGDQTLRQPHSEGQSAPGTPAEITEALKDLSHVADTLNNSQRVESVEDKTAYLAQAFESLDRLERRFQASLPQPERNILARIATNWMRVVTNALQDVQGRAQLEVALKTRRLLNLEQATLPLELTNTGRSPASNVTVTLVPDQTYAVSNGTAHLDILPAGRSAVVELAVSAAPSVGQFRAEFNITFDDRERSGKNLAFADMVHLLRPTAEFQPLPNPYAPGTPLSPGSPIFFGRDDLFQFIAENIAGLARQNILVLIGQRRMGKTSFLQQLPARLGGEYLPVYIDGQSLGIDPGMANFFYDLALAIVDALDDQGIEIEEPEEFEERPSGTFERSFRALIVEPVAEYGLIYDDLALDKMLRFTAGHPYFLQLTCHALVNRANREERGYLTIQDVNDVLQEMVELGEAHFAFLWEQSSPPEQLSLTSLTQLLGQEPTITAAQVAELLAERGVRMAVPEVTEARVRQARHAYYGLISYVDDKVGQLLQALDAAGLRHETIILFTSDHGEMLGERGLWYKMNFFEWSARIPLLFHAPERFSPRRIAKQVSLVDLAGNRELAAAVDGQSLVPLLQGDESGWPDTVLGEMLAEGAVAPCLVVRRGRYKYIYSQPDPNQLYDLTADPNELQNLAGRPEYEKLRRDFKAEILERWDPQTLRQSVIESQRRRRLVAQALMTGRHTPWGFQPQQDASKQYMRNHLDLNDLERQARFPSPETPEPDFPSNA